MNVRVRWLRDQLKVLNIQGMIVSNPVNIKYLTGIDAEGTFLITQKDNIFLTDSRYTESVNSILTLDDEIIVYDVRDVSKEDYENFFMFYENVGFEEKYVTYEKYKLYMQLYKANLLVETEGIVENHRTVKDEEEIENVKKACEITDKCFEYIIKYIKRGMTEKEIAFEMEKFMLMNGADEIAFETIVASGHNSSMPHAKPTNRKIREGDVILLDFGCKCNGYCSDMTRTVFMSFIDEDVKETYEFVLKQQKNVIDSLKDGANIKIICKNLENEYRMNNFQIAHALGHGVGFDVHEIPYFSSKHDLNLKENMIVAIEPGVYIPGRYGIRIEDTVHITKNGCIILTKSAKNEIIIKDN